MFHNSLNVYMLLSLNCNAPKLREHKSIVQMLKIKGKLKNGILYAAVTDAMEIVINNVRKEARRSIIKNERVK